MSVNAVDSGGRFATASVNINVTDSNNHPPNFENTPYIVDVFEDTPVGSTVLMLFASDLDHGRNAKINYRLQSPSETFHVERDTGALVVSTTIDRESVSTYILTVIFSFYSTQFFYFLLWKFHTIVFCWNNCSGYSQEYIFLSPYH